MQKRYRRSPHSVAGVVGWTHTQAIIQSATKVANHSGAHWRRISCERRAFIRCVCRDSHIYVIDGLVVLCTIYNTYEYQIEQKFCLILACKMWKAYIPANPIKSYSTEKNCHFACQYSKHQQKPTVRAIYCIQIIQSWFRTKI